MTSRGASILYWAGFVALIGAYVAGEAYHLPLGPIVSGLIVVASLRMLFRFLRRPSSEPQPDPSPAAATMFALCLCAIVLVFAFNDVPIGKIIGITVGLLVLVGGLLFVRMVRRMKRDNRAFATDQQEAAVALASGDFVRAGAILARWTKTDSASIRSHVNHGLVTILIRRGDFDEALSVIGEGDQNWQHLDAALVHALRGELDDAESSIASLDQSNPYVVANSELPCAIWNCRNGASADVVRGLHERWPSLETQLTAQHLRPLQIVRAFAEASDVRQAGVSAMSLANLRPHYKGEHAYLGKAWPEMAAFLAANGLD